MSRSERSLLYTLAYRLLRVYWRLARPHTHGVRVWLQHPQDDTRVLLMRHSYGERSAWSLPGGGYRPKRESPAEAGAREVGEELGVAVGSLVPLGEHHSEAEGKRDHVLLLQGRALAAELRLSREVAEARWFTIDEMAGLRLTTVTRRGMGFKGL